VAKNFISEDDIEQALLQRLQHLCGFNVLNCFTAQPDDLNDGSGRGDKREVILADRLRAAVERLNPQAPAQRGGPGHGAPSIAAAHGHEPGGRQPRDGRPGARWCARDLQATDTGPQAGQTVTERLEGDRLRCNLHPQSGRNEYLAVSQLWIAPGPELGYRRPDVLLYVNGLPLVFIELKNSNVKLRAAFDDNLTTYKAEIPQLFVANACACSPTASRPRWAASRRTGNTSSPGCAWTTRRKPWTARQLPSSA
jgi:type I restriction enzyme R subunit